MLARGVAVAWVERPGPSRVRVVGVLLSVVVSVSLFLGSSFNVVFAQSDPTPYPIPTATPTYSFSSNQVSDVLVLRDVLDSGDALILYRYNFKFTPAYDGPIGEILYSALYLDDVVVGYGHLPAFFDSGFGFGLGSLYIDDIDGMPGSASLKFDSYPLLHSIEYIYSLVWVESGSRSNGANFGLLSDWLEGGIRRVEVSKQVELFVTSGLLNGSGDAYLESFLPGAGSLGLGLSDRTKLSASYPLERPDLAADSVFRGRVIDPTEGTLLLYTDDGFFAVMSESLGVSEGIFSMGVLLVFVGFLSIGIGVVTEGTKYIAMITLLLWMIVSPMAIVFGFIPVGWSALLFVILVFFAIINVSFVSLKGSN